MRHGTKRKEFFEMFDKQTLISYLCQVSTPFDCLTPDGEGKFEFQVDDNGRGSGSYVRMMRSGGTAWTSFEINDWTDLRNHFKGYTD